MTAAPAVRARRFLAELGPWPIAGAAAGLAFFGYAGWDGALWDPRYQLLVHVGALSAVVAMAVLAWRGAEMPRTRIDLAIVGLLTAYVVATLLAQNHGLAARALASVLATSMMLWAGLVALRRHPALVGLVVSLPVLALAAMSLAVVIGRRLAWYAADPPTLVPPARLEAEGTPFGSLAVGPFAVVAVLPLTGLITDRRLRTSLQIGLVAIGAPLTLLSGSRAAWLAVAAAAVAYAAPQLPRLRRWRPRWTPRSIGLALGAFAALGLGLLVVVPRLTAITSVLYRGVLWRDTLAAWSSSPLFGIGPGTMQFARQAAAADLTFPERQPHSHNIGLGVLGDAGVVGLAAAIVLLAAFAWFAGPWRSLSITGRAASAVLIGFVVAGMFEDLTFEPAFSVLVVLLAAVALADAGGVRWRPLQRLGPLGAACAAALVAIVAVLGFIGDAAAIMYRSGTDAASDGDWRTAHADLERAVQLDPWHPSGPKALTVAADATSDRDTARQAAEHAVRLNDGDGAAWANLALLYLQGGDPGPARAAAERALANASFGGLDAINAARVAEALGDTELADRAYGISLLIARTTAIALPWPREVATGDVEIRDLPPSLFEVNRVISDRALGATIDPATYETPLARVIAYAFIGGRTAAQEPLQQLLRDDPYVSENWHVAAVVRRHWGQPWEHELAIASVLAGAELEVDAQYSPPALTFDVTAFRALPRDGHVTDAERLVTDRAWPWLLVPLLPAEP